MSTQVSNEATQIFIALCVEDPGKAIQYVSHAGQFGDQLLWELVAHPDAAEALARYSECPIDLKKSLLEILDFAGEPVLS